MEKERICSRSQNTQAHLWNKVEVISWAWAPMASSGMGSLGFIDGVTHDGSCKMNSENYRNILSANLKGGGTKLIRHHAARQQPKTHCQNKQGVNQLFRYKWHYLRSFATDLNVNTWKWKLTMPISCLIFIFWCQTQMFSVYCHSKGIDLAVSIALEWTESINLPVKFLSINWPVVSDPQWSIQYNFVYYFPTFYF